MRRRTKITMPQEVDRARAYVVLIPYIGGNSTNIGF